MASSFGGAITIGQHYQDDDIAYGDVLLEAVGLDKSGKPPRHVIGSSVEPLILKHLSWYGDSWAPHHEHPLEDPSDGGLFINYLGVAPEHFDEYRMIDYQLLAAHSKMVRRGLQEYESDTSVRQKYTWLAAYHNHVCHTFSEQLLARSRKGPDPEGIDLEAEAQSVLEHLVPFDVQLTPRPLDAQRLGKRLAMT